jgi:hypothetical protein
MQIPNLRIIDKQFNLLAVLDTYTSFQGERSLWEIGKLELHIGLKDQGAEALEVGNLVLIDEKRVWEITGVKKTEDDDLNLMVSGHELKGIFKQRVVIPDQKDDSHFFGWDRFPDQGDAPAEAIMRHYVEKHAVNPSDPNRAFPALIMAPYLGRGMSAVWSERFKRLDETLRDIGEYTGMGNTVTVDLASERFVFDVIPERIQTAGSEHPVIMSVGFENIENIEYNLDTSNEVTLAYAGGAGEDEFRLIQAVSRTPDDATLSGYARRETWQDCGSVDNIDDLIYEAQYQLSKMEPSETLTCSVLPNSSFQYLRDWDIGSIVTVQSRALGIEQAKKITSVKEVYERGRIQIIPTFGKRNKNILDEIRKTEVVR